MVSAWVLIPLPNHNPAFFPSPQALRNLTGPDQDLKLNPQSHILFYKVFFSPSPPPTPDPRQIYVAQTLIVPPRHSFLFYPPFQNLVLKVALLSIKRRADAVKCCICKFSFSLSFFTSIFNFIFIFHFP